MLTGCERSRSHLLITTRRTRATSTGQRTPQSRERIQRSEREISGYSTSEGNIRARLRADVDGGGAYVAAEILEPDSGKWAEHFRSYVKNRDVNEIVGFAADPNIAFIQSNVGTDKTAIYEYDVRTRKRKETLFQHRFFDAGAPLISRSKTSEAFAFGEVRGITYRGPRGVADDILWTSPKMQALDKAIRSALGLRQQKLTLRSRAGQSPNRLRHGRVVRSCL